ncbi:NAD(P)H-binding protein [Secundilactobacillus folii]|uniref:NAD(P)H-binding protein n=1 Tax=Secundilactobacillus folii TaxID=2678357 RepID=A0A7X3C380_9LACO|nr:NAD(P)H-binding protein [Secundilactobacillus folii]MTV82247.1 NAD(P)H-binding protein [Secundilactobacillus folii]
MSEHILLLGASGTAGEAIRQALLKQTDAQLTLVSRHANRLNPTPNRETLAQLDVNDHGALTSAMKGQTIVVSALSAENNRTDLGVLAQSVVTAMEDCHLSRLIFMVAMGIYNEIPAAVGAQDNVENNPSQEHNLIAANVVTASNLNYTLLRPGFLTTGNSDPVITPKGTAVTGNRTSLTSLGHVVVSLVTGKLTASRGSLGINEK